jgi:hypothetical protein
VKGKELHRMVNRLPAGTVKRLDAMAASVTASTGQDVSRAAIVRAVIAAGLMVAESDADFGRKARLAVLKPGRKASGGSPPDRR